MLHAQTQEAAVPLHVVACILATPLQEGAGHAVLSAYVEIVFDNSDNRIPVRWLTVHHAWLCITACSSGVLGLQMPLPWCRHNGMCAEPLALLIRWTETRCG